MNKQNDREAYADERAEILRPAQLRPFTYSPLTLENLPADYFLIGI